eukprot:gene5530-2263_t
MVEECRKLKAAGADHATLNDLTKRIRHSTRIDKDTEVNAMCAKIEQHGNKNETEEMFQAIKSPTNKRSQRLNVIKDEDNHVLTESKDIQDRWKRYCENLYAKDDSQIEQQRIMMERQDQRHQEQLQAILAMARKSEEKEPIKTFTGGIQSFSAFDSATEWWTDYWARFNTFTEATSIP